MTRDFWLQFIFTFLYMNRDNFNQYRENNNGSINATACISDCSQPYIQNLTTNNNFNLSTFLQNLSSLSNINGMLSQSINSQNVFNTNQMFFSPEKLSVSPETIAHASSCLLLYCPIMNCSLAKICLFHKFLCNRNTCMLCLEISSLILSSENNIKYNTAVQNPIQYPSNNSERRSNVDSKLQKPKSSLNEMSINSNGIMYKEAFLGNSNITSSDLSSEVIDINEERVEVRDFLFSYHLPMDFDVNNTINFITSKRKRPHLIDVQWIKCQNCGKNRKIPRTFPTILNNNFKCNYNIWDVFRKSCDTPEEKSTDEDKIDLSGNYPLYEIESTEFIKYLTEFYGNRSSSSGFKTPCLGTRLLDIYRLFREVMSYGGCEIVTKKNGTWINIYKTLDNYSATETSASFRLKKIYNKYLIAIEEEYFSKVIDSRHLRL